MASGNLLVQWHGTGGHIPVFTTAGNPPIYVSISYSLSRSSSNRTNVTGSVSVSLHALRSAYSYFGYSIICGAYVVGKSNATQLFSKGNYPDRGWATGTYSGSTSFSFSDTTNRYLTLRIYFQSNCDCTPAYVNKTGNYDITVDIGEPYTVPNLVITSINGVDIQEGEGNYEINVNANQDITIGYSAWSGAIGGDACSIDAFVKPYDRTQNNLSWKTIRNDGANCKLAGSALYKQYNDANDVAYLMGSGVPFEYDDQEIWIYAKRHHSYTGKESAEKLHSSIRLMRVLYTPIKEITFVNQPTGLYEQRQSIPISWTYPTPPSLIDQYGIVSGYEIRLINRDTGETELTDDSLTTNYILDKNAYKALTRYMLQIIPYYDNSGVKSYGPSMNSNEFMLITRLNPPTISYPNTGSGCVWIGNKLYLLAQLPYDPDILYAEGYIYRNLEVVINGVSYTFKNNQDMFSIGNLGHNLKFVFTTKNINIPFSTSYNIKTRVQKNYSFDGINYGWSDYSSITLNSVQVPSIPIYSGYVYASHYNPICNYVTQMRNCYIEPNDDVLVSNVNKGDYILRSDFQDAYNDLNGISQLIDQWGEYSKDLKVKFSQNIKFSPKIEYITDLKDDTNPIGNNYFILSYEWIRYYG